MQHDRWQAKLVQLLTVPGMVVAYYLLLFHNGAVAAACSGSGWDDCGSVSGPGAPYSAIGPVPVALIGLLGYALIFLIVWSAEWWPLLDEHLSETLVGTAGFALLFTLALTGIELFVIHAVCRYCVVSALIVVVIFALSVSSLRSSAKEADS